MNFTEFIEEIKSGKHNVVFYFVCFVFLYHLYYNLSFCKNKIENMADVSDAQIAAAVKNYYLSDEFIKNISIVSAQLQRDGLIVSGNLTVNGTFNLIPRGTIVAFNSDKAPESWALCDGTNGTPDLRGRFIRMHSSSLGGFNEWGGKVVSGNITAYDKSIGGNSRGDPDTLMLNHRFGDKAGTDHQTLHPNEMPVHSHGMDDAGHHSHTFRLNGASVNGLSTNNSGQVIGNWGSAQNADSYIGAAGNHRHGIQNAGGGWGHNNQPPYYVLSYIMKL